MTRINDNFLNIGGSYLFSEIARRVAKFSEDNPGEPLIKLGIGDVTRPLAPAVVEAMKKASDEMGSAGSFRGYGPEQGYGFLREAVAENDYKSRGVVISPDEIFISDGAKSDVGNIGDIFSCDNVVAVADPVYPVYVDTSVMAGRAGRAGEDGRCPGISYISATAENGFCPTPHNGLKADMIYLCFPNNPTGAMISREGLKKWVDFALENHSVILYDSAYEAYISDPSLPHSIYEIDGAKRCAIEFRSFSKTAGFTGTRCAYTVVPHELCGYDSNGGRVELNPLWNRRQCTKFNGVPYVVQRAAEAVYSPEGKLQTRETIKYYMTNARIIREGFTGAGFTVFGGENAPYVWLKTPGGAGSWEFFDKLLHECRVVTTPGAGFGPCGEGYIRLTAFGTRENTEKALERITARF